MSCVAYQTPKCRFSSDREVIPNQHRENKNVPIIFKLLAWKEILIRTKRVGDPLTVQGREKYIVIYEQVETHKNNWLILF
jgi:hypothetical protein